MAKGDGKRLIRALKSANKDAGYSRKALAKKGSPTRRMLAESIRIQRPKYRKYGNRMGGAFLKMYKGK